MAKLPYAEGYSELYNVSIPLTSSAVMRTALKSYLIDLHLGFQGVFERPCPTRRPNIKYDNIHKHMRSRMASPDLPTQQHMDTTCGAKKLNRKVNSHMNLTRTQKLRYISISYALKLHM